jgi:hypothetical protein
MEQVVHITVQELARVSVAQESSARPVGKGAAASQVNPINRLGRRIEQELDVFFTVAQGFVNAISFSAKGDFVSIRAIGTRGRGLEPPPCNHSEPDMSQPTHRQEH